MTEQQVVDTIDSLAFSVHAQPGVYALLLGSGVSRGSGVPTGWEVLEDLIRKLAVSSGIEAPDNPAEWYRTTYKKAPSYSDVLEQVGSKPAERKAILRSYFEPTDEERAQGIKIPGEAHMAIAELVDHGYIRVIVTTNFDRLIENALVHTGIDPVVLSTPQEVANAEPLAHMKCCIVKLHGDYLDPSTLNTVQELSDYSAETKNSLKRIFEDYGLVVCGWSADWDQALRKILRASKCQHYTSYWHVFGTTGPHGEKLIQSRSALPINQGNADSLFGKLREKVLALEDYNIQRSSNNESTTAAVKRYLPNDRHHIQLADLIKRETDDLASKLADQPLLGFPLGPAYDSLIATRIYSNERDALGLASVFAIAGYWAPAELNLLWTQSIASIGTIYSDRHDENLLAIRYYPSFLILFAFGLGAIANNKIDVLSRMLKSEVPVPFNERHSWFQIIRKSVLQFDRSHAFRVLDDYKSKHFPFSERVHDTLSIITEQLPINQFDYDTLYDRLEILIALGVGYHNNKGSYWTLPGRYAYLEEERSRFLSEIRLSLVEKGDSSSYVACGLFGSSAQECRKSMDAFEKFAQEIKPEWWRAPL